MQFAVKKGKGGTKGREMFRARAMGGGKEKLKTVIGVSVRKGREKKENGRGKPHLSSKKKKKKRRRGGGKKRKKTDFALLNRGRGRKGKTDSSAWNRR